MTESPIAIPKEFARRLLGFEKALGKTAGENRAVFRVCEKLRGPLGKRLGIDGFRSLLTRAQGYLHHDAIQSLRDIVLTDDIIRLRYVEIDGQLRKIIVVIKMRGSNHSKDIREYVITGKGLVMLEPRQAEYMRLSSGLPERIGQVKDKAPEPKAKG